MNIVVAIFLALLFFILTPGVVLRLPQNGGKLTVAFVHAIVFGIIVYFTEHLVWKWSTTLGM
jgi:hypothetical protein